MEERECLECKKKFKAKRDVTKFCSTNCRVKFHQKNKSKEKGELSAKVYDLGKAVDDIIEKAKSINFSPVNEASYDGLNNDKHKFDEINKWVIPEKTTLSYNEYYSLIPRLNSIDKCKEADEEVAVSNFSEWQKNTLKNMIKERSKHPDLN